MSGTLTEKQRQARACYIHEAGHAVMALKTGKTFIRVFCDGNDGYVEAHDTAAVLQNRHNLQNTFGATPVQNRLSLIQAGILAFEDEFKNLLAGLAAENFDLGRAALSVMRGTDDLSSVYIQLSVWLSPVPIAQRLPMMNQTVTNLMGNALQIIRANESLVRAIADALEKKNTLLLSDINPILLAHPLV